VLCVPYGWSLPRPSPPGPSAAPRTANLALLRQGGHRPRRLRHHKPQPPCRFPPRRPLCRTAVHAPAHRPRALLHKRNAPP
jgi:hypothetical protein